MARVGARVMLANGGVAMTVVSAPGAGTYAGHVHCAWFDVKGHYQSQWLPIAAVVVDTLVNETTAAIKDLAASHAQLQRDVMMGGPRIGGTNY